MSLPPFLMVDSKQMWRAIPDKETGETRFSRMDGWKVVLIHTKTFTHTTISASRTKSGVCYTVKGPPKTTVRRGSWNPQDHVTKQNVLKFSGTEQFRNHVRQRYEPELASQILTELGVT